MAEYFLPIPPTNSTNFVDLESLQINFDTVTITEGPALQITFMPQREVSQPQSRQVGQRVEGQAGFYSYGFSHGFSGPSASWNWDDGFGVNLISASGELGRLGRESNIINNWFTNDTSLGLAKI